MKRLGPLSLAPATPGRSSSWSGFFLVMLSQKGMAESSAGLTAPCCKTPTSLTPGCQGTRSIPRPVHPSGSRSSRLCLKIEQRYTIW
jgi:hypothetical protein